MAARSSPILRGAAQRESARSKSAAPFGDAPSACGPAVAAVRRELSRPRALWLLRSGVRLGSLPFTLRERGLGQRHLLVHLFACRARAVARLRQVANDRIVDVRCASVA